MESRRGEFFVWAIAAWVTPAIVAQALGWSGIWGAGGALLDYLIPIPVAGGVLHVPTFVVALLVARAAPALGPRTAALLRAASLGAALVGLAMLLDLERIAEIATTDLTLRRIPWERNAVGLFLLTDALWVSARLLRRPPLAEALPFAVAIAVAAPALYVFAAVSGNERLREPMARGLSRAGPERGDEVQLLYSRLAPDDPAFREAARAAAGRWFTPPEEHGQVEDLAVFFTLSRRAASFFDESAVVATWCLYEDGTPESWHLGAADCFSDHVTFTEKLARSWEGLPRETDRKLRHYVALRETCRGVEPLPPDPRRLLATDVCASLAEARARLEERWKDDPERLKQLGPSD